MHKYENTANKLRPQKFQDLVGQEFVVNSLLGSIHSNSVAGNAFLLSGPRGVGKTSAARLIALAINRPKGQDVENLEYEGSDAIRRGTSLDVAEIDGASYTSVEHIRKIREEILYVPVQFDYKVYIIDEVHMLSNSAFNALLKTIEEPPSYIVFIFATTELEKVPLTIRSRCQRFAFHLIPHYVISQKLEELCALSNTEVDSESLEWMAKEARGSLRDAYTLFDQIRAFCGNHITKKAIDSNLGLAGLESLNTLFKLCTENNYSKTQEHITDLLEKGCSAEKILFESCEYLRNILLIKNGIHAKMLIGFDIEQFDASIYEKLSIEQLEHALQLLLDCYRNLRNSLEPQFEIELAFNQLCSISNYTSPNMLVQELKKMQAKLQHQLQVPTQTPTQTSAPVPAPAHTATPTQAPTQAPAPAHTDEIVLPQQASKNTDPQEEKKTVEQRVLEVFSGATIIEPKDEDRDE